ncbi:hypothetical protein GCM10010116_04940 [Microbispora rosea subsp. aerata]|nr:DUF2470 domain-containing protein [Microbispora rosea]GGO02557.1 hypothetical protein GCM10010116_04940 [Microbispora rosea subsp. aerata]GIH54605.1 hypothetical protein Mro02_15190 [Microbispora rosea subsp. aerata]GLJ87213.1 hypothetical protein GCM10017588_59570 [Microbispora rosea subsp. aerata]
MRRPVTAPPVPERVRSLAALAAPTHVSVAGSAVPAAVARGGVDGEGRPVLLVKPGEILHGAPAETLVTVDLTVSRRIGDAERPRALLKVRGWTQPVPAAQARATAVAIAEACPDEDLFEAVEGGAPALLRVDVSHVIYLTGQESGVLDAESYLASAPDPLLSQAERMVRHVNESHSAQVREAAERLTGEPATEAWLWELDRYGATLRPGPGHLVRVAWPSPVTTPAALGHALTSLLRP